MKCRICASECPPGAKLCRDCAAARKRAFAATVTQPLLAAAGVPSVGRPRFAPRPERQRPTSKRPAATAARSEAVMAASAADGNAQVAVHRSIGVQWLLLALAVACAIVYLVIRILFEHQPAPDSAKASGDAASAVTAPATAEAPPPSALAPTAPGAAAPADTLTVDTRAEVGATVKSPGPKHHKAAAKVETPVIAPVELPQPAAEPVAAPRSPPPVAQAPRDPWQVMNEGLSRCAREDWLSRGACEQRLRMQYCPGHWGLVWQCPLGPPSDHGQ